MIKCDLFIFDLDGSCGVKATKFIVALNNGTRAYCASCWQYVPGKKKEITEEQYLNYQVLK